MSDSGMKNFTIPSENKMIASSTDIGIENFSKEAFFKIPSGTPLLNKYLVYPLLFSNMGFG